MLNSFARTRLIGLAMLALAFGVGGLAGAAFTRVLEAQQTQAAAVAVDGGAVCEEKRVSILDQLDLTPEQRGRVDVILAHRRDQTEVFWDSAGPRLEAIMDATREEIRAILTPEQQAEYHRLRAERRAQRERREQERRGNDVAK